MLKVTAKMDEQPRRWRTIASITPRDIESSGMQEGDALDFKRSVTLDTADQKAKFLDDIVAFLNRGEGRLIIGVKETEGRFSEFHPLHGNADKITLQMQSLILDAIHPTPFDVLVLPIHMDDGFILDVQIPRHTGGPFMNGLNGVYLLRTGARNRPIDPGALRSRFVDEANWIRECQALTEEEDAKLDRQSRLVASRSLRIGILPQEHFDLRRAPFTQHGGVINSAPNFGERSGRVFFKACEDGHEVFIKDLRNEGHFRLFVRDDWFIHARVSWAVRETPDGRLALPEFEKDVSAFIGEIAEFLQESSIEGPFAISLAMLHLHAEDRYSRWFSNSAAVRLLRPMIVHEIDDAEMLRVFFRKVLQASVYG